MMVFNGVSASYWSVVGTRERYDQRIGFNRSGSNAYLIEGSFSGHCQSGARFCLHGFRKIVSVVSNGVGVRSRLFFLSCPKNMSLPLLAPARATAAGCRTRGTPPSRRRGSRTDLCTRRTPRVGRSRGTQTMAPSFAKVVEMCAQRRGITRDAR